MSAGSHNPIDLTDEFISYDIYSEEVETSLK